MIFDKLVTELKQAKKRVEKKGGNNWWYKVIVSEDVSEEVVKESVLEVFKIKSFKRLDDEGGKHIYYLEGEE